MKALEFLALLSLATPLAAPGQTLLKYMRSGPCCMATDAEGNIYIASQDSKSSSSDSSARITKFDPSFRVVYEFLFPVEAGATIFSIAVDNHGNVLAGGRALRPDQFPLVNELSGFDARYFLIKLDGSGRKLLNATGLPLLVYSITFDRSGSPWLGGSNVYSSSYPVTPGAFRTPSFAAIMQLNSSLDRVLYSTVIQGGWTVCPPPRYTGCGGVMAITAIRIGADRTITVAGTTTLEGYPGTPGAFQTECHCNYSAPAGFISRLSADGSKLLWSTYLNGPPGTALGTGTEILGMELTRDGGVVVAGNTSRPSFPVTPGAVREALIGPFIAKLNVDGSALVYSAIIGAYLTNLGGPLFRFRLDDEEHPWLTGVSSTSSIYPSALTYQGYYDTISGYPRIDVNSAASSGLANAFVVELSSDGATILKNERLPNLAAGRDIIVTPDGDQILTGSLLVLPYPNGPLGNLTAGSGFGSLLRIPHDETAAPAIFGIANAAGYFVSDRIAPGEIISIYGRRLGPAAGLPADASGGRIGTELGGTRVLFDGVAAPILYSAADQINAIVPFAVSTTPQIQVTTRAGSSSPVLMTRVQAEPQIPHYAITKENSGDRYGAARDRDMTAALNEDGTVNTILNPAPRGSILTIWVNGAGVFDAASAPPDGTILGPPLPAISVTPSVTVGYYVPGHPLGAAEVLYAGPAPGMVAGVMQVNFRIPADIVTAVPAFWPVSVQVGSASGSGWIALK
jgi:uncharacterized protein (TIGR03437 family)